MCERSEEAMIFKQDTDPVPNRDKRQWSNPVTNKQESRRWLRRKGCGNPIVCDIVIWNESRSWEEAAVKCGRERELFSLFGS
jgi:hypothetical protein